MYHYNLNQKVANEKMFKATWVNLLHSILYSAKLVCFSDKKVYYSIWRKCIIVIIIIILAPLVISRLTSSFLFYCVPFLPVFPHPTIFFRVAGRSVAGWVWRSMQAAEDGMLMLNCTSAREWGHRLAASPPAVRPGSQSMVRSSQIAHQRRSFQS